MAHLSPMFLPRRAIRPSAWAAGAVAIAINSAVLRIADLISLPTARGGLFRLVSRGVPMPGGAAAPFVFHLLMGMAMALFYAGVVEPSVPGRPLCKAMVYAAAAWVLNASVILPATGQGFAGATHLTVAGMVWFLGAHTIFFIVLALCYARFEGRIDHV